MSEWKTIDSAPKDGTWFWAHSARNGQYDTIRWAKGARGYEDHFISMLGYGGVPIAFLTHWMPLPEPPNDPQ